MKENKLKIENFNKKFKKIDFSSNEPKQKLLSIRDNFVDTYKNIKKYINFEIMKYDLNQLKKKIEILSDIKKINSRDFKPEDFEKLFVDIFTILNDSKKIVPNYPIDEDGEPLSHASSSKPDFECFYK